jgi:hypothetical protein
MALVLTGIVQGMRPVGGEFEDGPRKGEKWQFLSLEIADTRFGKVYSCQMRDGDQHYKDFVEAGKLKQDWTGHKVKATVMGVTAGLREIEDKATGEKREIMQVRMQITNLRDLGLPDDEE